MILPAQRKRMYRGINGSRGRTPSTLKREGGLMALDRGRLIQHFDYLSTVSGGGYIGSWLSKLLKVLGDDHVQSDTPSSVTFLVHNRALDSQRKAQKERAKNTPSSGSAKNPRPVHYSHK
jgi:hypothetical protein